MLKSNLKTYVVSLKTEKIRRAQIKKILDNLGIAFDFFDAINPNVDKKYLANYNKAQAIQNCGRELTTGELGCNLSHQMVYKDLVESKHDFALVLEDDALVNLDIVEVLNSILEEKVQWDVVLLGYSKINKKMYSKINFQNPIGKSILNIDNYSIGVVNRNYTSGTVGYLISNNAAKKIIDDGYLGVCLADNWDLYHKKSNLKIYHCRPFLIFEDFENLNSSISYERDLNEVRGYSKSIFFDILRNLRGIYRYIKLRL